MTIRAVKDLGAIGLVKDLEPHEIPDNAFSSALNVTFRKQAAQSVKGMVRAWNVAPPIAAYGLWPVISNTALFWLMAGISKVYAVSGGSFVNVTRQSVGVDVNYTGTADTPWIGGLLSGIPVITNGVDLPQVWNTPSLATRLTALPNWPTNATCRVIRPFKEFLVALDVTKGGTRYPYMVKWSHPADPGTVPVSWDETSTLYDAGEYDLSDTPGYCLDAVLLRDIMVIYKEDAVYGMQYVGGVDVFRFFKMFQSFGLLAPGCAIEFINGQHFVVAQGNIYVHDGQSFRSILTDRLREYVFGTISSNTLKRSFVVRNLREEEVWFCYPTTGSAYANRALIWNWATGALGLRELPQALTANVGLYVASDTADAWSSDSNTWDSSTENWGDRAYTAAEEMMLFSTATPLLLVAEQGNTMDGAIVTVTLERTGLSQPFVQESQPDYSSMKFFRRMWPRISGTDGGVLTVEAGVQQTVDGPVVWLPGQNYVIGETQHIDFRGTGRLLSVRFSSSSNIAWQLLGYEIDVTFGGKF